MPILQLGRLRLRPSGKRRGLGSYPDWPAQGTGHHDPAACPSVRFLVYGRYCSQVESASKHLDHVATAREDVQMKLEVGPGPCLGDALTPSQAPGAAGRRLS